MAPGTPASAGPRILVVDDDEALGALLRLELLRRGFSPAVVQTAEDALSALARERFDVLVADLNLGTSSGLDLSRQALERDPDLPILVITAYGSIERAVEAIRTGAYDFITKPLDMDALALALERAVGLRRLRDEVMQLRVRAGLARDFGELVGQSEPMRQVYAVLERVAQSDVTVLVTGESGTGKELVARALHGKSRRKAGPLVAINCGALPEQLMESELFGHAKGAFTDAKVARRGLFVEASGGTLFLDEVGEMPAALQAKLLRALQERRVRPVGETREVPFDVRLVAATNVHLEKAVEEGRFREDLYYRLNVVHVHLPPLRERGGDVLLLAQRFLAQAQDGGGPEGKAALEGFTTEAAERLLAYPWPGNVRELYNCMEHAAALSPGPKVDARDLPERVRTWKGAPPVAVDLPGAPAELLPLAEVERRHVLRVLEAVGGNRAAAAQALGVDRSTLYRKLAEYGVTKKA